MKKLILFVLCALSLMSFQQADETEFRFRSSRSDVTFFLSEDVDGLIAWAVNDVASDIEQITGQKPSVIKTDSYDGDESTRGIYVGTFDDALMQSLEGIDHSDLAGRWETFLTKADGDDLYIAGSDVRGVVYGIFDLAERIGISPWQWWADVAPEKRDELTVDLPTEGLLSSPSVQYRGIFLNDEDWGLRPWAADTFEPETDNIGPKTYEKIFQLLLRLKANAIWPAMHPGTQAFYTVPGNMEMAQRYHIVIGTSHAEPMLRNNVDEWSHQESGDYNYFTNSAVVDQYWRERIEQVQGPENQFIVTVGMRGIHDSNMVGADSQAEQVEMLGTVIRNQRQMLKNILGQPAETIPQIFVPYKEVLELYNAGLEVPDDITLVWPDDNYGYIRRLSNEAERTRTGGSGVYYHLSYWGRPHDYLWLSSTQPGLIWFEMTRAYQNGARKIWIANVGDIKPTEYNMEFFLDLAWDVNSISEHGIKDYMVKWAAREFGDDNAVEIADLMTEYYRLAFLRRPEFMAWSQVYPDTPAEPTEFSTTANSDELQRRINAYAGLVAQANGLKAAIASDKQDAYFQLVEYPVKGAALMNYKFLYAQSAYQTRDADERIAYAEKAEESYEEIKRLTDYYNNELSNGKWKHMMSLEPRDLPVFRLPEYHLAASEEDEPADSTGSIVAPIFVQASDYFSAEGQGAYEWKPIEGLGYSGSAITLFPLENARFEDQPSVSYRFDVPRTGAYEIEVRLLPTHSNTFDHELTVQIDDKEGKKFDALNTIETESSETWKRNVLRNYRSVVYPVMLEQGTHELTLSVNQTGIVIDQIAVNAEGYEAYYEIFHPGRTDD